MKGPASAVIIERGGLHPSPLGLGCVPNLWERLSHEKMALEHRFRVWLLTSDPATRDHCLKVGSKRLVVPEKAEKGFREGLRKLGYIFPAG